MKPDPQKRLGRLQLAVGAWLLRGVFTVLGRSCRFEVVAGNEHLDALLRAPRPVILSFWHNQIFLSGRFVFGTLRRRGLDLTLLASQSRDGELVSRVFQPSGVRIVRGSSTRGGRQALREVYRAITRHGSSPVMIPDGPHGPLYHFKVGVAVLGQMSQAPVLPLGFAAARCWRIGSWDRLMVPKPFTRIALAVGEPYTVPRGSAGDLESARRELENRLNDLTHQAEMGCREPADV